VTLGRMASLLFLGMGARVFGAVLVLLVQLELARTYSAADVAAVLLTMSTAALLSLVIGGGHAALALTELPKLRSMGRGCAETKFHRIAFGDCLVLLSAAAAVICGLLVATHLSRELQLALVFGLASAPFSAMLRYNCAVANSARQYGLSQIDNTLRPSLFAAVVGLNSVLGWTLPVVYLIAGFVAANAVTAIIQLVMLRRSSHTFGAPRVSSGIIARSMRARAVSLFFVVGLSSIFADVVTLLAGLFLGVEEVAAVGIAVRLAAVAGFAIQTVQEFVLPDLAALRTAGSEAKRDGLLLKANLLMVATLALGVLATVVIGRWVLGWFGESYRTAHFALILLMLAQTLRALGGMNHFLLSMEGQQLRSLWSSILSFSVLGVCWSVFVPDLHLTGVGVAAILAELTAAIVLAFLAQKYIGFRGDLLAGVMRHWR
jgi:O-antigen/teichoic acid export membrane protein